MIKFFRAIFQKSKPISKPKKKEKKTGEIRYFNRKRGFGFIRSRQTSKDVFVHINEMDTRPRVGDKVRFELRFVPEGPKAINVELVS